MFCRCTLVWTVVRPGLPQIKSLEDWESKNHAVDPEMFRMLLDPSEELYLRQALSPHEFRLFQRKRMALAMNWLNLVGENAAMLMKLGQLAKTESNPALAREAADLIHGALRLRVNLMLVEPCLWLKWIFPGWALTLPAAVETPYQELLTYPGRMRQQRQWGLPRSVMAADKHRFVMKCPRRRCVAFPLFPVEKFAFGSRGESSEKFVQYRLSVRNQGHSHGLG